jgi:glutamine synthetase
MQGRLQGKRLHARFFLDTVLEHGTESCNYLLAVDVDMNTVDGYALTSWSSGYGDFVMKPDLSTLAGCALAREGHRPCCCCDLRRSDGRPRVVPRAAADPARRRSRGSRGADGGG